MKDSGLDVLVGAAFGLYEWDYHRRGLGVGHESIPYDVSYIYVIAAKLSPYWCENM